MACESFSLLTSRLSAFRGTLSLVGTTKNAGKTTALNYLLRHSRAARTAVTSIGRDGEEVDVLETHRKPSIVVAGGTLFATAMQSLERCVGNWSVERSTAVETALGQVVVCRAKQPCRVELAGPSQVDQLARLAADLRTLGAERILIDGAFDRVAAAAGRLSDAVVLAVGSCGRKSVEDVAEEARGFVRRFTLPELPPGQEPAGYVFRPALTEDQIGGLGEKNVVLPDASTCLFEASSWRRIDSLRISLWVKRRVPLLAVFVNPFRPHLRPLPAPGLLDRVRAVCGEVPAFDLKLEGEIPECCT